MGNKNKNSAGGGNSGGPILFGLVVVLGFLLVFFLQKQYSPNHDDVKLHDVEQLGAQVGTPDSFVEVGTNHNTTSKTASISKSFRSTDTFAEVKTYYLNRLNSQGWKVIGNDERLIKFMRGEYGVAVEHRDTGQSDSWNYGVSIEWNSP